MDLGLNSKEIVVKKNILQKSKFCLFVRCGKNKPLFEYEKLKNNSLIDVYFSLYQDPIFPIIGENFSEIHGGLSKYHAFHKFWNLDFDFRTYKSYWLIDEDIIFQIDDILKIFEFGLKRNLNIWQPALSKDSYSKWDFLYHTPFSDDVKYTTFIEVMAPIFSNFGMVSCVNSFSKSFSTWGLDFVWSKLLKNGTIGVLNSLEIKHLSKPDTKNGAFYRYLKKLGINPYVESFKVKFKYNALTLKVGIDEKFYFNSWIESLYHSDSSNTDLFFKNLKITNYKNTVFYFLNHFSLSKVSEFGILPAINSFSYSDGFLLKYQLGLKGKRRSFDFTGIAIDIFEFSIKKDFQILAVGGTLNESEIFQRKIKQSNKGIKLITMSGFADDEMIIDDTIQYVVKEKIKIILLGLGTPKQEYIANALANNFQINGCIIFTCGGFISQTANSLDLKYYPKLIDKFSLRWLWRIFNTRYVFKRVILNYPRMFIRLLFVK